MHKIRKKLVDHYSYKYPAYWDTCGRSFCNDSIMFAESYVSSEHRDFDRLPFAPLWIQDMKKKKTLVEHAEKLAKLVDSGVDFSGDFSEDDLKAMLTYVIDTAVDAGDYKAVMSAAKTVNEMFDLSGSTADSKQYEININLSKYEDDEEED